MVEMPPPKDHRRAYTFHRQQSARRPQLQTQQPIIRHGDCPLRYKAEVARSNCDALQLCLSDALQLCLSDNGTSPLAALHESAFGTKRTFRD
jgi:hypothetical protein